MAVTPSTLHLKPGSMAPGFTLPVGGSITHRQLSHICGEKGTLILFVCNHCPYVVHLADAIGTLAGEVSLKGITTVAINANDVERYPEDSPDLMETFAEHHGWDFPYLYDESQEVAKAYHAACTPDFFLFDKNLLLHYRGQFDDSRPGNGKPVTGKDLRHAIHTLLIGQPPPEPQLPSMGCNIKWKPGNEPA